MTFAAAVWYLEGVVPDVLCSQENSLCHSVMFFSTGFTGFYLRVNQPSTDEVTLLVGGA